MKDAKGGAEPEVRLVVMEPRQQARLVLSISVRAYKARTRPGCKTSGWWKYVNLWYFGSKPSKNNIGMRIGIVCYPHLR